MKAVLREIWKTEKWNSLILITLWGLEQMWLLIAGLPGRGRGTGSSWAHSNSNSCYILLQHLWLLAQYTSSIMTKCSGFSCSGHLQHQSWRPRDGKRPTTQVPIHPHRSHSGSNLSFFPISLSNCLPWRHTWQPPIGCFTSQLASTIV